MRVIALVPAYRPPPNLVERVRRLLPTFDGVVVVDDGSGDGWAEEFGRVAALPGVTLLRHAVNLGKGAALKTGINHIAVTDPAAGLVTVDADGQHRPEDAAAVRAALEAAPDSLVVGSRHFEGRVPLRSLVGNRVTQVVFRAVTGVALGDTQSGLRGLPAGFAVRLLELRAQRYEFELDMLLITRHLGVAIVEVPIGTVYEEGNRSSHFNPVLDSVRIYFALLRFGLSSLAAAAIDNVLFMLFYGMGASIAGAQVGARLISASINYLSNRSLAFHSEVPHRRALPRYAITAVAVGFLSYGSIRFLNEEMGLSVLAAKLLAETLIFLASFLVQRDLVFRRAEP